MSILNILWVKEATERVIKYHRIYWNFGKEGKEKKVKEGKED